MRKKICFVNCSSGGSTGNIVRNLTNYCGDQFDYCFILGDTPIFNSKDTLSLSYKKNTYKIARLQTFLFGNDGFLFGRNKCKIKRFLKEQKPDLIHLHNVHRSFCNIDVIFKYCKQNNIKIIWTLHDQWAFTGHCCYSQECNRWKKGCGKCPNKEFYPRITLDRTRFFAKKKTLLYKEFAYDLTFVCPSNWLNCIISSIDTPNNKIVVNNGINTSVFKIGHHNPTIKELSKGKFIIGGAALYFNSVKGKEEFFQIHRVLPKDIFFIVLIGSDKNQIEFIDDNFVILPRTSSAEEMACFYNSLDVFINPTKIDNYPTTHLESISCGTPVITYKVGGAGEMIKDGINGFAVPLGDTQQIVDKIIFISKNKNQFKKKDIASSADFSLDNFCRSYLKIYKNNL